MRDLCLRYANGGVLAQAYVRENGGALTPWSADDEDFLSALNQDYALYNVFFGTRVHGDDMEDLSLTQSGDIWTLFFTERISQEAKKHYTFTYTDDLSRVSCEIRDVRSGVLQSVYLLTGEFLGDPSFDVVLPA